MINGKVYSAQVKGNQKWQHPFGRFGFNAASSRYLKCNAVNDFATILNLYMFSSVRKLIKKDRIEVN